MKYNTLWIEEQYEYEICVECRIHIFVLWPIYFDVLINHWPFPYLLMFTRVETIKKFKKVAARTSFAIKYVKPSAVLYTCRKLLNQTFIISLWSFLYYSYSTYQKVMMMWWNRKKCKQPFLNHYSHHNLNNALLTCYIIPSPTASPTFHSIFRIILQYSKWKDLLKS